MPYIWVILIPILAFEERLGPTIEESFYIIIGCAITILLHKISNAISIAVERGYPIKSWERIRTAGAGTFTGMLGVALIALLLDLRPFNRPKKACWNSLTFL